MVNFSSNNSKLNKKRGISTIVGGIIFLVLLTAGFSAFFVAMDVQSDTIDAQRTISDSLIDKTQEQFAIAVATDETNNNQLGIYVKNQGPNPVEISNIWIINKSEANQPTKKIEVDYSDAFIPAGYSSSILEHQLLYMLPNDYDIKVVSTLGTIEKSELKVGGVNYLQTELYALPADVRLGENATIVLRVTNIGPSPITNITPDFNPPQIDQPPGWIVANQIVSPSSYDLIPGESAIFTWHVRLSPLGTVGDKIQFTDSVTGTESATGYTVSSNTVTDKIVIRQDEGGGGDLIVLSQELLSRPEIFIVAPSSWGKGSNNVAIDDKGLWGVNVVNPTNAPMKVSKVTITVIPPGANNNDKVFDGTCDTETIYPTGTNYWSCPTENQISWKVSPSNAVTIPAYSPYSFLVNLEAGNNLNVNLESMIVHASVFTTVGAFGKAGYESSMNGAQDSLVNVYLSKVINSTANAQINSTRVNIQETSTQTFNIVLADMDGVSGTYIQPGSHLIINVPKKWDNVNLISYGGFVKTPPPSVNKWADDSWQIIGTTDPGNNLGNGVNNAATITFRADAPDVTGTQMYVMYVLADGTTNANASLGPLAEIVLQVID